MPLYVPATGAKGSTKWADKTEDEILADITGMLKQVARTTKKVEKPDTLALRPRRISRFRTAASKALPPPC